MKRSPDWRGHWQTPRNPSAELSGEYGWLTFVKRSAGDRRYCIFRCRCGDTTIRYGHDVREAMKLGRIPACPKCRGAAKRANKAERERQTG